MKSPTDSRALTDHSRDRRAGRFAALGRPDGLVPSACHRTARRPRRAGTCVALRRSCGTSPIGSLPRFATAPGRSVRAPPPCGVLPVRLAPDRHEGPACVHHLERPGCSATARSPARRGCSGVHVAPRRVAHLVRRLGRRHGGTSGADLQLPTRLVWRIRCRTVSIWWARGGLGQEVVDALFGPVRRIQQVDEVQLGAATLETMAAAAGPLCGSALLEPVAVRMRQRPASRSAQARTSPRKPFYRVLVAPRRRGPRPAPSPDGPTLARL